MTNFVLLRCNVENGHFQYQPYLNQSTLTIYLNQDGGKLPHTLNPTYYGPFGAISDIWGGGTMYPPISYACSTCAIVMKL